MWERTKKFFSHSETIFLARFQVLLGAVFALVTYVEPHVLAPILPEGLSPWWLVIHGIGLEYLRRRRANDLAS